jgi:hypothetical protein
MTNEEDWPFDQVPNVAAISDAAVVDGNAPVLLVVHYSDDHSWAFLSGGRFTTDQGKVIGMGTALRLDPTLSSVADLPPGWTATRKDVGSIWSRRADPDV